eukprot:TRINITY_DN27330_c0_g1_i7.p1 TRINITY_DN27330_c0_g1~~TRINITY_DN27330_c0_g1_i7.p1  ORF type:complete len:594 (-),score=96.57 TRINITY_DN27330_c0_g1_i7:40-1821(-)
MRRKLKIPLKERMGLRGYPGKPAGGQIIPGRYGLVWGRACSLLLKHKANVHAMTDDFHVSSVKLNGYATGVQAEVACVNAGFGNVGPQWLDKGLLPIHLAAFGGHVRTVQLLVRHGQSINATTQRHCWTPLMYGVWSTNATLVQEVCRLGGRSVVNKIDRRSDGSEWTPLSLAVVRSGSDTVQALVAYGADPLMRLAQPDFPGIAFIKHCGLGLADAPNNVWSGPDSRISVLHLAVVRGCIEMLRTLIPLVRAAHFSPVRCARSRPPLAGPGAIPWQDAEPTARSKGAEGSLSPGRENQGEVTLALARALDSSKVMQDRARNRLIGAPVSEAQDCDPIAFCTFEGWSPAVLAALLHAVDPQRKVTGTTIVQGFPDKLAAPGSRADVFQELLRTGSSLLEDRKDARPPMLPQRFPDVSETLVITTINEFAKLCKECGADHTANRILHTTLCVACHFNRMEVVRHLLKTGLCDPRCPFLRPIEHRPLHIATSAGHGYLAQLLLDYQADPCEDDENKARPVHKLASSYENKISDLQVRVRELEMRLAAAMADGESTMTLTSSPKAGSPRSPARARTNGGGPVPVARYESMLHDSRM